MSAIPWFVWVGGYAVGWFNCLPRAYGVLYEGLASDSPVDAMDTWFISFFAVFLSFLWPLVLVIVWVRHQALKAQGEKAPK